MILEVHIHVISLQNYLSKLSHLRFRVDPDFTGNLVSRIIWIYPPQTYVVVTVKRLKDWKKFTQLQKTSVECKEKKNHP